MKKSIKKLILSTVSASALLVQPILLTNTLSTATNVQLYSDDNLDNSILQYTPTFNFSKDANTVNYSTDYGKVQKSIYHDAPSKVIVSTHNGIGYYDIHLEWNNFLGINPLEQNGLNNYLKNIKRKDKWVSFREIYETGKLLSEGKELMFAGRNPNGGVATFNITNRCEYEGAYYNDVFGKQQYAPAFTDEFVVSSIKMNGVYLTDGQKDFTWTDNGWTLKYSCSENLFDVLQFKYNSKEWPHLQASTTKKIDFTVSLTSPNGEVYSLFHNKQLPTGDKTPIIDSRSECYAINSSDYEPSSQISCISSVGLKGIDLTSDKKDSFNVSLENIVMYDYCGEEINQKIVKGWLTATPGVGVDAVYLSCDKSEPIEYEGNFYPPHENAIVDKETTDDLTSEFKNYKITVNPWETEKKWSTFNPVMGPQDYWYKDHKHRQYFSWYYDYSSAKGKSIEKISSFYLDFIN